MKFYPTSFWIVNFYNILWVQVFPKHTSTPSLVDLGHVYLQKRKMIFQICWYCQTYLYTETRRVKFLNLKHSSWGMPYKRLSILSGIWYGPSQNGSETFRMINIRHIVYAYNDLYILFRHLWGPCHLLLSSIVPLVR